MNADQRLRLNAELKRLARGDRSASQAVFELAWPTVKGFCRRWLAGSADADDAAQQALLKLFAQAPEFDPSRDALSWLLEIATWECRSLQKRKVRHATTPLEAAKLTPDDSAGPEAQAEANQLREAVNAVAAQLSEGDREELNRVLQDQLAGDAAGRKRRQRALERFARMWRSLHADE